MSTWYHLYPSEGKPSRKNPLRKLLGWPLTWLLYLFGHGLSRIMVGPLGCLYPLYNRAMLWSSDLNDWAELAVWSRCEASEIEPPPVGNGAAKS